MSLKAAAFILIVMNLREIFFPLFPRYHDGVFPLNNFSIETSPLHNNHKKGFKKLKYSERENIFPHQNPKIRETSAKYFPFHLIFHSLNIEMEKLVEWNETWPKNFQLCQWKVPINISISIPSRTIDKNRILRVWIPLRKKLLIFGACYFIGNIRRRFWVRIFLRKFWGCKQGKLMFMKYT